MNFDLSFRKANPEDVPQIVKVDNEVFGIHAYGGLVLRQFFDIAGKFFFVAVGEKIIGYIFGAISAEISEGWILSLAVSSSARKQGIGEKLTNTLIDELTKAGAENILLTVEPNNTGGIKLYEKLGFVKHSFESDYYGASEDRIIMKLSTKL